MSTEFEPITATSRWNSEDGIHAYAEDDQRFITELLMGHKVTHVEGEHLVLDNGTVIKAVANEGGCSCGAGDYDLTVLNTVDNIITRVEFDYHPAGDGDPYDGPNDAKQCDPEQDQWTGHYRIFVYAENQKINLMQFDGSDGNGYYGTGFELLVRYPEAKS